MKIITGLRPHFFCVSPRNIAGDTACVYLFDGGIGAANDARYKTERRVA